MATTNPAVDLGIAVSGALLAPGQTRTHTEIAAFANCSKQNIERIERIALKKLRHRILFNPRLKAAFAALLAGEI